MEPGDPRGGHDRRAGSGAVRRRPGVDVEIVMSTFAGTLAVKDTTPVKLLVLLTVRVKMIWLLTKFVCDELVDCISNGE